MALGNYTTFTLDMVPGGAPPIIHVSAGDIGRKYTANLMYNGEPYDIQGNRLTIAGTKPDNTVFEYPVDDFEQNESWVEFLIKEQMAIVPGTVRCKLREYLNDDQIGSATFILDVDNAVFNPDALSESEVIGLSDLIESATTEAVADWFENDAPTSETFTNAVGTAVADYVEDNGVGFTLNVSYKTRPGYVSGSGSHSSAGAGTKEVYTNKLPCFPGDTVTYSFTWESTETKWATAAFYDENGRFISRSSSFSAGSATSYSGTFTIPANVYYYSVSWRTYDNCTAVFTYTGSVYNIRNRIDKGLSRETIGGGYDTTFISSPVSQAFEYDVQKVGNSPLTDFIPLEHGQQVVAYLDTTNFQTSYMALWFDEEKAFVNNSAWSNNEKTVFAPPTGTKYVRFTFAAGADVGNIESYYSYKLLGDPDVFLTPIICGNNISGANTNRPTWDTVNKTFTIPYDCIFFKNGKEVRPSYLMDVSEPTVLTIPTSSTALRLFFDVAAKEYVWRAWSENIKNFDDLILVAVFRTFTNAPTISINSPYIIDGKPYGIDTTAEVDLDAVAWAFGENVKGINHRGYNTAPENTLPAYKLSKKVGFKYCECDVSMTSDRVPVLLHDGTINRTARNADGTEISSTISIGSITYEQALQYDFGIYKGSQYAGTKIPTFAQFILLCRNLGLHPYIELKSAGGYTQAEIENLVDIVELYGMKGKVTWISFSSSLLEYVKNYDAAARLGFIVGEATSANVTMANGLKTANNEVFLDVSSISSSIIGECASANIPVEIWTVNSTATIEGLDPYITGVTSDNLIAAKVLYEANI